MRGSGGGVASALTFNHVKLFGGSIWYVDGVGGDNTVETDGSFVEAV